MPVKMSIKTYLNEERHDTKTLSGRGVVIKKVDVGFSSFIKSLVDKRRLLAFASVVQQVRLMNGKAVLLDPSTNQSFISIIPQ